MPRWWGVWNSSLRRVGCQGMTRGTTYQFGGSKWSRVRVTANQGNTSRSTNKTYRGTVNGRRKSEACPRCSDYNRFWNAEFVACYEILYTTKHLVLLNVILGILSQGGERKLGRPRRQSPTIRKRQIDEFKRQASSSIGSDHIRSLWLTR